MKLARAAWFAAWVSGTVVALSAAGNSYGWWDDLEAAPPASLDAIGGIDPAAAEGMEWDSGFEPAAVDENVLDGNNSPSEAVYQPLDPSTDDMWLEEAGVEEDYDFGQADGMSESFEPAEEDGSAEEDWSYDDDWSYDERWADQEEELAEDGSGGEDGRGNGDDLNDEDDYLDDEELYTSSEDMDDESSSDQDAWQHEELGHDHEFDYAGQADVAGETAESYDADEMFGYVAEEESAEADDAGLVEENDDATADEMSGWEEETTNEVAGWDEETESAYEHEQYEPLYGDEYADESSKQPSDESEDEFAPVYMDEYTEESGDESEDQYVEDEELSGYGYEYAEPEAYYGHEGRGDFGSTESVSHGNPVVSRVMVWTSETLDAINSGIDGVSETVSSLMW